MNRLPVNNHSASPKSIFNVMVPEFNLYNTIIMNMFRLEQLECNRDVSSLIARYAQSMRNSIYLYSTITTLGTITPGIGTEIIIDTGRREKDLPLPKGIMSDRNGYYISSVVPVSKIEVNPWVLSSLKRYEEETSYDKEIRKLAEKHGYKNDGKLVSRGWVNFHLKEGNVKRRMNSLVCIGNMGHLNDKLSVEIERMTKKGCAIWIGFIDMSVLTGSKHLNHDKLDEWCKNITDRMDNLVGIYQDSNIFQNINAVAVGDK